MIAVCRERGFASVTIAAVCERARVSRQSFYMEFDGLQDCFVAVMDDGCRRASELIAEAFASVEGAKGLLVAMDGVRAALAAMLRFFEEQPGIARVWVLESLAAGAWAIERRERNVTALTEQIVSHWDAAEAVGGIPLVATGTMAAVLGLLQRRMLDDSDEPLLDLLPSLMEMVAVPYLDPAEVVDQVELARALVRHARPARDECLPVSLANARGAERLAHAGEWLPPALLDPRARRVRECVTYMTDHPGASNRQIANAIGIVRHSQVSALLKRLERLGLICVRRGAPGRANAWELTPFGEGVAHVLGGNGERSASNPG